MNDGNIAKDEFCGNNFSIHNVKNLFNLFPLPRKWH